MADAGILDLSAKHDLSLDSLQARQIKDARKINEYRWFREW